MQRLKIFPLLVALLLVVGCGVPQRQPAAEEQEVSTPQELVPEIQPPAPVSQPKKEPPQELEELLDPEPEEEKEPIKQEVALPQPLPNADFIPPATAAAVLGPLVEYGAYDSNPITWGPGPTTGEAIPPAVKELQQIYGDQNAYFYNPDSKEIFLSFDEGYELGYTESLLDTLKEKNVKAVFFVTYGYVQSRPDLVTRMINEGHILGNHSTTHPVGGMPTLDPVAMAQDILTLHYYVREHFGYEMTLFRPPEGTFSPQSLAVTHAVGYKSVFWSFAYNDWNPESQMEPEKATTSVVNSSHPGGIYLLHAVSKTNTEILGTVIDQLQNKGYTFSTWENLA